MNERVDQSIAVCKLLGLDPSRTTNLSIEWDIHHLVTARWEGYKVLTEEEKRALGELLQR